MAYKKYTASAIDAYERHRKWQKQAPTLNNLERSIKSIKTNLVRFNSSVPKPEALAAASMDTTGKPPGLEEETTWGAHGNREKPGAELEGRLVGLTVPRSSSQT